MSTTPRTDAKKVTFEMGIAVLNCTEIVDAEFAGKLERELTAAEERIVDFDLLAADAEILNTLRDKLAAAQKALKEVPKPPNAPSPWDWGNWYATHKETIDAAKTNPPAPKGDTK